MTPRLKLNAAIGLGLIAGSLALGLSAAAAEMSMQDPASDIHEPVDSGNASVESIGRSANVESKLSSEFSGFLGGKERAAEVVSGLRTGEEFHITELQDDKIEPTPFGSTEKAPALDSTDPGFSIAPPTDSMGYGNVRLTMRLAQANLETLGITHPTNEQLSAMLVGGDIDGVHYQGILNERAAGAGWGEIAQRYDFKVGQLMGNAPSARPSIPVDPSPEPRTPYGNGYIPSGTGGSAQMTSGQPGAASKAKAYGRRANGYVPSGSSARGHASIHGAKTRVIGQSNPRKGNGYIAAGRPQNHGSAIRPGHGASSAQVNRTGHGHAKGLSKGYVSSGSSTRAGIVSASNLSATAATGAASRQGHAKGHAKQHAKHK